jgi:hypothetical protein
MVYTQPTGASPSWVVKRRVHRLDASSVPSQTEAKWHLWQRQMRPTGTLPWWAVRYSQPPRETASYHKGLSSAPRVRDLAT